MRRRTQPLADTTTPVSTTAIWTPRCVAIKARMRGRTVGEAGACIMNGKLAVEHIEVDPKTRRRGVATRMYEEMARQACRKGLVLVSDDERFRPDEAFWRKQVAKGRAVCARELPEAERTPLKHWDCDRYRLVTPCAATIDLSAPCVGGRRRS